MYYILVSDHILHSAAKPFPSNYMPWISGSNWISFSSKCKINLMCTLLTWVDFALLPKLEFHSLLAQSCNALYLTRASLSIKLEFKINRSHDADSYQVQPNFSNYIEKPEKFRASTGFKYVTSRCQYDTLTNWAMKPQIVGADLSWVHVPVTNESMDEMIYMLQVKIIFRLFYL